MFLWMGLGKRGCHIHSCTNQDLVLFEANVMTVVGLFSHVSQPLSIKSDQTHPHSPAKAEELKLLIRKIFLLN